MKRHTQNSEVTFRSVINGAHFIFRMNSKNEKIFANSHASRTCLSYSVYRCLAKTQEGPWAFSLSNGPHVAHPREFSRSRPRYPRSGIHSPSILALIHTRIDRAGCARERCIMRNSYRDVAYHCSGKQRNPITGWQLNSLPELRVGVEALRFSCGRRSASYGSSP